MGRDSEMSFHVQALPKLAREIGGILKYGVYFPL